MSQPPAGAAVERRRVPLSPDGRLTVGVVADTHSRPDPRGVEHLRALRPHLILHAGDIGDRSVLDTLEAIAPTLAVRGNIDERAADLPEHLVVELTASGTPAVTLLLTHIALAGPRLRGDAARLARAASVSLVVCGHSHVPFIGKDRGLTVFNPGSVGPRRFTLPILFGVLAVNPRQVELRHVDAATGQAWAP